MAIYTNLPVYKATYSLLLSTTKMLSDIPRDSRYSIGADLRGKLLAIIVLIYRANRTRQKVPIIGSMRELLLEAQVYLRLLCDLRHLSERRYAALLEQSADISRQLAAWEKSERAKHNDKEEEETEI